MLILGLLLVAGLAGTSTLTYTLTSTGSAVALIERVDVIGHRVLGADLYRALAALPDGSSVTAQSATKIALRIERFLRLAGYDLARVHAHADHGRLILEVDEGHLERIVFPGGSGLGALRLQLQLDLPDLVFNRRSLERQLDRFRREDGVRIDLYRLVPVGGSTTAVEDRGSIGGISFAPAQGRHELQIFVTEPDLPQGWGLELEGGPADGAIGSVRYRFASALAEGDRIEFSVQGGLRVGKVFANQEALRWLSRLAIRTTWYSPELFGKPLRAVVDLQGLWWNRSRIDLGLSQYDFLAIEPHVGLRLRLTRFIEFELGGGAVYERLLRTEAVDPAQVFNDIRSPQPLIFGRANLIFGPESGRIDELHRLELSARQVFGTGDRTVLFARYTKTWAMGWNELVLHASALTVAGSPPFYALERAGAEVRGLSSDKLYTRLAVSAGAEYRLSLVRELYKVGVFYDGALFQREPTVDRTQAGYTQSFGLGGHLLLLSTFRLSVYLAFGFADSPEFQPAAAVTMLQVF